MLDLEDISIKETRFYKEVFAEGELLGELRGEQRGEQRGIQEGLLLGEQRGEQRGIQEGLQQGQRKLVEYLLQTRFGNLDEPLLNIIDSILALPPAEFMPLLLNLSKEELIARFQS